MEWKRRIDKKEIPVVSIMGVNIAAVNMNWLLEYTEKHISELSGDYMAVANVYAVVTAYENPVYKQVENHAVMAIPDGGPLASVGRKRGYEKMERTTGPSYMGEILKLSSQYHWKHFFYGSTKETTDKMITNIKKKYPDLDIAGVYNPPFRPLTKEEDQNIIQLINESDPDFVWIGLGAPKQEFFMAEHQGKIKGFMTGVGAAFDYYAGNIKRAPEWMQKANLEWLYRLIQDPKHTFKKYLKTNPAFIWNAVVKEK